MHWQTSRPISTREMIKREKVEEKEKGKAQSPAITVEKFDTLLPIVLRKRTDSLRRRSMARVPRRANHVDRHREKEAQRDMASLDPVTNHVGIIRLENVGSGLTVYFSTHSDTVGRSLGQERLMMLILWM